MTCVSYAFLQVELFRHGKFNQRLARLFGARRAAQTASSDLIGEPERPPRSASGRSIGLLAPDRASQIGPVEPDRALSSPIEPSRASSSSLIKPSRAARSRSQVRKIGKIGKIGKLVSDLRQFRYGCISISKLPDEACQLSEPKDPRLLGRASWPAWAPLPARPARSPSPLAQPARPAEADRAARRAQGARSSCPTSSEEVDRAAP